MSELSTVDSGADHATRSAASPNGDNRAAARRVEESFALYDARVRRAEREFEAGRLASAAVQCAIAAGIAANQHCGIFADERIERLLGLIGRKSVGGSATTAKVPPQRINRVLHVLTEAYPVGGVTKMLGLWLKSDEVRRNDVILTQHRGPIPSSLLSAIAASGSQLFQLNHEIGNCLEWAANLRSLAAGYDAVVLHIHCEDVIAPIAFAEPVGRPPVLLLNHADHIFWIGSAVADVILNLRDAAHDLSIARRGTEPRRNVVIPTLTEGVSRTRTRAEAKRSLGIPDDSVLCISVARAPKFRTHGGMTYAELLLPVLQKLPQARLIVVGAGEMPDWRNATEQLRGRLQSLSETPDTATYFEAADVYVDSYPFVSSTSMLEAANYQLPLLTLDVGTRETAIFGFNHIGLVGNALLTTSVPEYRDVLTRLIVDREFRTTAGEAAFRAIRDINQPPGWFRYLDEAFAQAAILPKACWDADRPASAPAPSLSALDVAHQARFRSHMTPALFTKGFMGMLPPGERYAVWRELSRQGEFTGPVERARLLLPEWLRRKISSRLLSS